MNKLLGAVLGIGVFTGSLHAADVSLVRTAPHTYIVEVSNFSYKDTNSDIIRSIAKKVSRKGYSYFLLPHGTQWRKCNCYMVVSEDLPEKMETLAEAYNWDIWNVDYILED